ncbi:MAG: shikimate dehydrogenase, partial [Syntrophobacter sp. DG_60]
MIDAETEVYGIIGHPVSHSLSPIIQNLAFSHHKINAVYLAFDVTDLASALAGI